MSIPGTEKHLGKQRNWRGIYVKHDHSQIVIDEVWGMAIASTPLIFTTFNSYLIAMIIVFALFRFFDITKIWPAKLFDRWQSPWGVMLDDGVAGVYSALTLIVIHQLIYSF
jgi:phosphatidylglycerophosphatase A